MPGKDIPETLNRSLLAEIKGLFESNPGLYCWFKISYTTHLSKKIQVPAHSELNRVPFSRYTNFNSEAGFATGKD